MDPQSDLLAEPVGQEWETLVLNLDCGHKRSIEANVATSPQRYSSAFCSQAYPTARPPVCLRAC